ncbi:MAG: AsmA family protein [Alistipes sp.]|nr:AsmA family protein [Alistipes sp.]
MKKVLKITSIALAVVLVALITLPMMFRGKIEALVKTEANKMLNAEFDFDKLDISLLRNFPSASLTLKNFWLKGVGEFENDTLVYAGELTAAVNVMSLFDDSGFDISKVIIDDTRVKAIILPDGQVNWDVMKPTEGVEQEETTAEESSPFRVKLQRLSIDNLNVIYDDRQGDMYAALKNFDAVCSGDLGSDQTTIRLKMATPALTFRMGGVPMLNGASIKADMNVDADLVNNKFTLNKNSIELNAIKAAIDGWVAMLDEGFDMDIALNTNEVGFKEVLSLIPAIYAKEFSDLKTDGSATLTAYAKGKMVGEQVPQFDVALNVKNAMFRYPSLPAGVDNINITAFVKNPGGNIDATTIKVNPFNFVFAGNPFSMTADVKTPVSDLDFNVTAKGKLDLGKVKDVYPLEDMNLNGVVDADMSLAGRMSYVEQEKYDQVKASGNLQLSGMNLQMEDFPDINIQKSNFSFTPRYLELSQTTINIGDNDITLDSRFENYLGFVFKGTTLDGVLNVSSNKINLNDFMSDATTADSADNAPANEDATAEGEPTGVIRVPHNINFNMNASFKKVLFNKMSFNDVKGLLVVKDCKVDMRNLSLNTMGGSVVVNGSYAAPEVGEPVLDAGFALNNIVFAEAYKDLDMVKQLAPIFEGLSGTFSGNINIDALLDEQMSPILQSVSGSGKLSTKDLSLSGVKIIDQVATIVNKPDLKNIRAKDLAIEFTINNGRVATKPFDLKLGDYTMNLSGTTGLDQSIDYRGKITLPASAGNISKLGTVDMTIGGTFTSPKVGIDMESLAKQAAQKAAEQVVKGLGEKLLGTSKTEQADSTATNNTTNNNKAAETVGKVLNLLKKNK